MTLKYRGFTLAGLDALSKVEGSFEGLSRYSGLGAMPPGLRTMESISAQLERLMAPTQALAGVGSSRLFSSEFAALTRIGSTLHTNSALTELLRQQESMLKATSMTSVLAGFQSRFDAISTPPLMRTLGNLERSLSSMLPGSAFHAWEQHLVTGLGPLAATFSSLDSSRFAVLAALPPEVGGASINWFEGDSPRVAALIKPELPTRLRRLEVEPDIEVCCAICDEPMPSVRGDYRWKGNRWVGRLQVAPFCATCFTRGGRDLGGYADAVLACLDDMTRVPLQLMTGGESDGVPRGRLRLVREDEES